MSERKGASLQISKSPLYSPKRRVWLRVALILLVLVLLATWRLIALGGIKIGFETSDFFCPTCAAKREKIRFELLGLSMERYHFERSSVSDVLGLQSSCNHPQQNSSDWLQTTEYRKGFEWSFQTGHYYFYRDEVVYSVMRLETNGGLRNAFTILFQKDPDLARERWRFLCSLRDPLTGMPLNGLEDFQGTAVYLAEIIESLPVDDFLTGQPPASPGTISK